MYLFRSPVNSLRRLIFNMGLWETDVGVRTGSAPIGAITVVIVVVTAGNKGRPKRPR